MNDAFDQRMKAVLGQGGVSGYFKQRACKLEDITFSSDANYKRGMMYDWDMKEIEEVDFKFQKIKEHSPEKKASEFYVQFRPFFVPETRYNDLYYKLDGKEHLGQYLDIPNFEKQKTEKWLLVGKEPKNYFNRYYVFQCNWCLEWVDARKEYHQQVGVWRDSIDNNINSPDYQKLGGSELDGNGTFILPSNPVTRTLITGTRVMITDAIEAPAVYEVQAIKDAEPLGVMKLYLKRCLINYHTDLWGNLNEMDPDLFVFDLPVPDLPDGYGQDYHYLCDCKISVIDADRNPVPEYYIPVMEVSSPKMRVRGTPVTFTVKGVSSKHIISFRYFVDGTEYPREELSEYFTIQEDASSVQIQAIHNVMTGYEIMVKGYVDGKESVSQSAEVVL